MTTSRQRSSSARSNTSDINRSASPGNHSAASGLAVPEDLILNDVPTFGGNTSSSSLLIPSYGTGSPYPTISASSSIYNPVYPTPGQRPRAATADLPASPLQTHSAYRPSGRPSPGVPMYQPGQRHASGADTTRQYVPPPPPMSPPVQQPHMMTIPPPPPRPMITSQQQQHVNGMMLPPPPGPPPTSAHGLQAPWQGNWGRSYESRGYPPPPPQAVSGQYQTYNPATQYPPPLSKLQTPQSNEHQMSATYIPGPGDSFGVGVGIPGLGRAQDSPYTYTRQDSGDFSATSETMKQNVRNTPDTGLPTPLDEGPNSFYTERERLYSQTPVTRQNNIQMQGREGQDYSSSGQPTSSINTSQSSNIRGLTSMPSTVSNVSGYSNSNAQASHDAAAQWPLDRVLLWLANNQFSNDWQETFKALDVHGASFLELGSGHGGRGNFGMMHQQVYPRLAKECSSSGTGWDQAREREEGKRMRRLIREIANGRATGSGRPPHSRRESLPSNSYSAGTDGTAETSPNIGRESHIATPTTANGEDDSPGKQMQFKVPGPGFGMRRVSQNKSIPAMASDSALLEGAQPGQGRTGYRNVLKTIDNGDTARRHSPSASSETGETGHFRGPALRMEGSPKSGSPGPTWSIPPLLSASNGNLSASPHSGKFHHRATNSTDSISSNAAIYGSGLPAGATQVLRGGMGGAVGETNLVNRNYDSRRGVQDGSRPSPLESERSASIEPPSSAKEHKGLFKHFRKKKPKDDGAHPSPEEPNLESPTSPSLLFKPSQFGQNARAAASETSLTTLSTSEYDRIAGPRGRRNSPGRNYALVTLDSVNYRLCDITDADSASDMRRIICFNLGLQDVQLAQVFLTELGRTDHDEVLDDQKLLTCRRTRADASGTLKLYIRAPEGSYASTQLPPFGKISATTSNNTAHSPGNISQAATLDDDTYDQLNGTRYRSNSSPPPPGSRQDTVKATAAQGTMDGQSSELDRRAFADMTPREQKAEMERRQQNYQAKWKNKIEGDLVSNIDYPIRGRNVNFDQPRNSPFEDKKTDNLLPQRKPPPPPGESATLTKVNSLREKSGQRGRNSWNSIDSDGKRKSGVDQLSPIPQEPSEQTRRKQVNPQQTSGGIGSVILGTGLRAGVVGYPNTTGSSTTYSQSLEMEQNENSQNFMSSSTNSDRSSPKSGGSRLTWGTGSTSITIPDHAPGEDRGKLPSQTTMSKTKDEGTRLAPTNTEFGRTQGLEMTIPGNRQSYGPKLDFKESDVQFQTPQPTQVEEDSDEDSDDGLFAVPIPSKAGASGDEKPKLAVNTRQAKKVGFVPPPASSGQNTDNAGQVTYIPDGDDDSIQSARSGKRPQRRTPGSAASENWSAESSLDMSKLIRRESFAREDVWASRPPAEALINHLDDFFPNLDVDQPVVVEAPPSPTSGVERSTMEQIAAHSGLSVVEPSQSDTRSNTLNRESDTLGSDESTLRASERPTSVQSVAQRNVGRSGGLGRMKSIREVARGAHEANKRFTAPAQQTGSSALLRRKSTKMFGANIVQIKPQRGSMVLPTIPQDKIPKRQPTFRWFKGQLIGKGTYGRVYLGMNATTGDFLAVKQVEISAKAAGNDKHKMKELVAALDLEIDTMKDLDHENIVQYLGCERKETSISIFLEYISGGSVGSCLRKHGKFEEPVVSSLTRQTLAGLAYLHREGILHRDLKADNILLDLDGTCKISDFGISKKTDDIYGNDASNSMQGSVFWMAPEVVRSHGHGYSAKVDIWSLGCVVLEMFAGRRPWSKEEAVGAIYKLGSLNEAPPIPDDVSSTISAIAVGFMADCFQIDPGERPTADTLLSQHPFCEHDPSYNFLDTQLYAKIRGAY